MQHVLCPRDLSAHGANCADYASLLGWGAPTNHSPSKGIYFTHQPIAFHRVAAGLGTQGLSHRTWWACGLKSGLGFGM
eukprot:5788918-Pyramimonas_sp.AAC.1